MTTLRKSPRARILSLFLPFLIGLGTLCLVVTQATATANRHELDQVEVVIETVIVEPSVLRGEPGWLWVTVSNTGTITACGVGGPGDCPSLALDIYINPIAPPHPEEPGYCFGWVPPVPPGQKATAVFSFTLDSDLSQAGYCAATIIRELWLSLEGSVYGPISTGHHFFLPLITSVR